MRSFDPHTQLSRTIASTHTLRMVEFQSDTVFHTPIEERFERITRLARRLFQTRIAAITVLDDKKQWFKSIAGWNISELPRQQSICAKIVDSGKVCLVSDLSKDYRFWDHPLVAHRPKLRFYCGYPLQTGDSDFSATFCILDTKPKAFTAEDLQSFIDFGGIAESEYLSDQRNTTVSELISKLGVARRAAMIDSLTKVWNRQGTDQLLRSVLEKDSVAGCHVTICMMDIDHFKKINDSFGHPAGDEVLRKLAARLVQCLRPTDIVARVGGDEFLLILPDVEAATAAGIVDRVHQAVSGHGVRTRKGTVKPTLSIGYVTADVAATDSARELIEQADQALLASKSRGRNCIQMAS